MWLSAEWLILGEGEMEKKENVPSVDDKSTESLKELILYLKEKDVKIEKLIEEKIEYKLLYELTKKELSQFEK